MTVMPLPHLKTIAYSPSGPSRRAGSSSSRNSSPRRPRSNRGASWREWIPKLLAVGAIAGGAGLVILFLMFVWYSRNLPDPTNLTRRANSGSTRIYDRTGETILYEIHGDEKRVPIKLADLPDYVKHAAIVAEDRDFYKHRGFDITGIARALWRDLRGGTLAAGGSTITQQLVKNTITGGEKTLKRKIQELILSYRIEQRFSKDEILELYFNSIPYGSNAYGIEAATQYYFKKPAKELTLPEAAVLAAVSKAPTALSPYGNNKDRLLERQRYILSEMGELGYIKKEDVEPAQKETLTFSPIREGIKAPHFVFYVKELLTEKYGEQMVETGGLKIITTIDLYKQKIAEEEVAAGAARNETRYKGTNAALLAMDPKTGQILAMVGSRDYFDEKYDGNVNVTLRPRQPGSSFKPIVYAAGFTKGFTPDAILYDVITTFKNNPTNYRPLNYDGGERGPVTIRQALAGSLNIPAVKMLYLTGVDYVLDFAQKLGYTTFEDRERYGLALVLGGADVRLIDHVAAFQTFAREGVYHAPTPFLRVEDSTGKVLEEYEDKPFEAIPNNVARMTTSILTDNGARSYVFGANSPLQMGARPVGAKTGTTNDWRDGWTIGFTPSLVTGVWTGNNNFTPMARGADGVLTAAPIWNKFMTRVLGDTPIENFRQPDPVPLTNPALQGRVAGEEAIIIDKVTGKRATDLTPPEQREERRYPATHNELYYIDRSNPTGPAPANPTDDPNYAFWEEAVQRWLAANGQDPSVAPPTEFDDVHTLENQPSVIVTSPVENDTVRGTKISITVVATATRGVKTIRFLIDGNVISEVTSSGTYSTALPTGLGQGFHVLAIEASDDVGNKKTIEKTFNYIP